MLSFHGSAVGAENSGEAKTLKVLTFNVWHGLRSGESNKRFPGEDEDRREQRIAWQIEEFRRLDPDVLLFQEVNPNQRLARKYADELGYDEIHKVTSCGLHLGKLYKIPRNMNEGLAILAKPGLGLRGLGTTRLSGDAKCSATWGFQTKESRYALFGEVTVQGRKVLLATTHLSSPPFVPDDFEARIQALEHEGLLSTGQREEILGTLAKKRVRNLDEMRRIHELIALHRRRMGPADSVAVVFGGDLNAEPGTPAVEATIELGYLPIAIAPDFHTWDPVKNHVNYEIGSKRSEPLPTFGLTRIERMLALRRTTSRQIDHLFVLGEIEPLSAEMVMDQRKGGILPSDHFGILAVLRLTAD